MLSVPAGLIPALPRAALREVSGIDDRRPDPPGYRRPQPVVPARCCLAAAQDDGPYSIALPREIFWWFVVGLKCCRSLTRQNYYIPPLIFAIDQDISTGEERRICIDGKQRCSSVVDFMDGKIPFVSPATGRKYWYKKFDPAEKGELCTPAMKNKFDMIQIQAVEYDGIADSIQRDIFREPLVPTLSCASR